MAVTMTVVMTRMIVFPAVFFTGRPHAMPLISTLATHFLRLFDGLFFRSEGIDTVGIFYLFGANSGDAYRETDKCSRHEALHHFDAYGLSLLYPIMIKYARNTLEALSTQVVTGF